MRKTTIAKDEMIRLYDEGATIADIATRANRSRQYVYNMLTRAGRNTMIDKIRREEKRKQEKFNFRCERWREPRKWWDQGFSAEEIATKLNIPRTTFYAIISRYRAEYGWFPKRHGKEAAIRRWSKTREWWDQGISLKEIAARRNTTFRSIQVNICKYRKKYGWFPKRYAR